jgi:hypothetical protein
VHLFGLILSYIDFSFESTGSNDYIEEGKRNLIPAWVKQASSLAGTTQAGTPAPPMLINT